MNRYAKYMCDRNVENSLSKEDKNEIIEIINLIFECKMYGFFNYKNSIFMGDTNFDKNLFEDYKIDEDKKDFFIYCVLNNITNKEVIRIMATEERELNWKKNGVPSNVH